MTGASDASPDSRDRIVDGFMKLLEEKPWREVGLADVAAASGVGLAEIRGLYVDRFAILEDFGRLIDQTVLAEGSAEGESARDRLFDVMMRRFDAMAPYKAGLRRLGDAARRDPVLATFLARNLVRAQAWLFAAAGLATTGPEGAIATRGAALVFADAAKVWLDDEDIDAAATMAALDEGLRRGDRFMDAVHRFARAFAPLRPHGTTNGNDRDTAEAA